MVYCRKFLRSNILKIFNEIALAFLSVESKTNILHVNINFTGNLFLGDIVVKNSQNLLPFTVFVFFERLHSQRMFFTIFFSLRLLVNNSRIKRVFAFLVCFIGFDSINFYTFFIKMSCLGSILILSKTFFFYFFILFFLDFVPVKSRRVFSEKSLCSIFYKVS